MVSNKYKIALGGTSPVYVVDRDVSISFEDQLKMHERGVSKIFQFFYMKMIKLVNDLSDDISGQLDGNNMGATFILTTKRDILVRCLEKFTTLHIDMLKEHNFNDTIASDIQSIIIQIDAL